MQGRTVDLNYVNYRYGFNGKENDDEAKGIDNQIDYGVRIYDPRGGHFFSGDPLTKKYPSLSPYQFSGNSPIAKIDIDGLEAWNATQKWNAQNIMKFENYVNTEMQGIKSTNKAYTCEDFALTVAITFAKSNGLPFKWQTDAKSFDSQDPNYKSFDAFLNDVETSSGAPDFEKNQNTMEISANQLTPGSIVTQTAKKDNAYIGFKKIIGLMKDEKVPHHVSVVSGVTQNDKSQTTFFTSYQGNFKEGAGRFNTNANPNSKSYPGAPVQFAGYNAINDTWTNHTLGTITTNISKDQILHYRAFNFLKMNVEYKYELKTSTFTTPGSSTAMIPGSTYSETKFVITGTKR